MRIETVAGKLDDILEEVGGDGESPSGYADDGAAAHVGCDLLGVDGGRHEDDPRRAEMISGAPKAEDRETELT